VGNLSPDGATLVLLPPRTGTRTAWMALAPALGFPPGAQFSHEPGVPARRSRAERPPAHPLRVVATTRNPFTRLVSAWTWTAAWRPSHPEADALAAAARASFDAYLAALLDDPSKALLPLTTFFAHGPRPHHLVRFEHQQHDLTALGVPAPQAPRHGSPHTADPGALFHGRPDRTQAVLDLYGPDLDTFGYPRTPPLPR